MMVGCFAVALVGCGDDGGSDDGGGAGAGSGGGGGGGDTVKWDAMGWIEGDNNPFGIEGPWYSYDDCVDAMAAGLSCTMREPSMTGSDSKTGWKVDENQVCAKGTAAAVANAQSYDKQWGFGIAFDLANAGGGATKMPYNATAQNIKGFSFNITGSAPPKIRINVTNAEVDNAAHFRQVDVPSGPAANQVVFTDTVNFKQGDWITARTTFDPTKIYAVQFQVFTDLNTAKPFDFCVSDFKVIK
jgi:hypothetical protein